MTVAHWSLFGQSASGRQASIPSFFSSDSGLNFRYKGWMTMTMVSYICMLPLCSSALSIIFRDHIVLPDI